MGMYTEIFFRAEVDEEAAQIIKKLGREDVWDWPDHEFFRAPRFTMVTSCSSYYFPQANHFVVEYDDIAKAWSVSFRANLKNYDNEIEKFFDWVDPHVRMGDGEFIGYSLYEEDEAPTLRFKEAPWRS
jgi:hypothetical protein